MNIEQSATSLDGVFISQLYEILAEKAFDSSYSVPKLCRDLGMSSSQVYRKLRSITGKSAIEIIVDLRLEKAREKLADARHIAEIAYECGFEDPDYFSRAFSKRFGIPPKKWRAQQLG